MGSPSPTDRARAVAWLKERLLSGPVAASAIKDEAVAGGLSVKAIRWAASRLGVVSTAGPGFPAIRVWTLGEARPGALFATPPEASGAANPPAPGPRLVGRPADPKRAVARAHDRVRRATPRAALVLTELLRKVDEDPLPCPTCKRGQPRSEELRMRAATALLDRGGIATKALPETGEVGPVIVFPPGTRMAVLVETPGRELHAVPASAGEDQASRP